MATTQQIAEQKAQAEQKQQKIAELEQQERAAQVEFYKAEKALQAAYAPLAAIQHQLGARADTGTTPELMNYVNNHVHAWEQQKAYLKEDDSR